MDCVVLVDFGLSKIVLVVYFFSSSFNQSCLLVSRLRSSNLARRWDQRKKLYGGKVTHNSAHHQIWVFFYRGLDHSYQGANETNDGSPDGRRHRWGKRPFYENERVSKGVRGSVTGRGTGSDRREVHKISTSRGHLSDRLPIVDYYRQ